MRHFEYLKTRNQTMACFSQLRNTLRDAASKTADHTVAFRPKRVSGETLFFDDYPFWVMLTDGKAKNRYWNCFGIGGQLGNASPNIAVEINHPYQGVDRRIAGRFLIDDTGRYAIGHTGSLGGGVKGLTKEDFLEFSGSSGINVQIDDKVEKLAFLSYIDQKDELLGGLLDYISRADRYRKSKVLYNREVAR